ncbi:MAG: redoxin domain-containing protein [Candidatus Heimdallarchaeaceae archaeon]
MKIKEDTKAIDFDVTDIMGNNIKLDDFKDKKLLLSFYRYASCPLCNLRISQLIQYYDSLTAKGLNIVAFFQSPKESILQYVGNQSAPFPIIPDPEREVYKSYGVGTSRLGYIKGGISTTMFKALKAGFMMGKKEGDKHLLPADFLIDNLFVKRVFYAKQIAEHISFEEILAFLE